MATIECTTQITIPAEFTAEDRNVAIEITQVALKSRFFPFGREVTGSVTLEGDVLTLTLQGITEDADDWQTALEAFAAGMARQLQ